MTFLPGNYSGWVQVYVKINDLGHTGQGVALQDNKSFRIFFVNLKPTVPLPGLEKGLVYQVKPGLNFLSVPTGAGLLRWKRDGNNDPLTVRLLTQPIAASGTLAVSSNGAFTFRRKPGFKGTVRFSIAYNDGLLNSDSVTVTLQLL